MREARPVASLFCRYYFIDISCVVDEITASFPCCDHSVFCLLFSLQFVYRSCSNCASLAFFESRFAVFFSACANAVIVPMIIRKPLNVE